MFEVLKNGSALQKAEIDGALEAINRLTRRELSAEDVYTFSVRACDDLPDRDYERFTAECLAELVPLYVGKPVIVDHYWSAAKQFARVYGAAACKEGETSWLRLDCYLVRNEAAQEVIDAIDGGILREVSVGCAVARATCSVCGEPYSACQHSRGCDYDGKTCIVELSEPQDAYELSFVAVPAQPQAGVVKGATRQPGIPVKLLDREIARLRLEKSRY